MTQGDKMKNLIANLRDFKCSNCGIEYQQIHAYIHVVLGIVCNDCLHGNQNLTDSQWA